MIVALSTATFWGSRLEVRDTVKRSRRVRFVWWTSGGGKTRKMGIRVWGCFGMVGSWASVIVVLCSVDLRCLVLLCCCDVGMRNAIGHHSFGVFWVGCWLGLCDCCVVFSWPMLCCAVVMLRWAMPSVIIFWGCFEMVVGWASAIVVLCCCDVGCDLGWAMPSV